jgi:hypothetical protein
MNFFITGIGHSGTMWLARVLGCPHESPDPRNKAIWHPWTPFPVERFWAAGADYGEVNGMLRYHLSAQHPGRERLIPRRAWLRRDPRAIIASWMDDELVRGPDELAAVCGEVLWHYRNLTAWAAADPGARVIDLETLSTDPAALGELASWLGREIEVGPDTMRPHRPTPPDRRRFTWGEAETATLRTVARRLGMSEIDTAART